MSFSQKHIGKLLVPWYNAAEWAYIYNILQSDELDDRKKALEVLKIWKIRTPLLSAGVEGTLIVLEALLCNKENLSESQIAQLYSLSLLRFLNICAANNEKQGTFNKTASKNDLPKWMIDIRHDIAHDHRLPSKSLLEHALNQSFQWLMEKYWKQQNDLITDYVVTEDSMDSNWKVPKTLDIYIRLSFNILNGIGMNEFDQALMAKLNYVVNKKRKQYNDITINVFLDILEEILMQYLDIPENERIGTQIAKILVTDKAMLATDLEKTPEGVEMIPKEFRKLWLNLVNMLYENSCLFSLVEQFLEVINNAVLSDSLRKVASIWIQEIFDGLLNLQCIKEELEGIKEQNTVDLDSKTSRIILKTILNKKNPQFKDCIEFESTEKLPLLEAKQFEEKILKMPNVYTLDFLERVMTFNKKTDEHIKLTKSLVENLIGLNTNFSTWNGEMFTLDNLALESGLKHDEDISQKEEIASIRNAGNTVLVSRWKIIKDTSAYQGCPLGVLPHQNRAENPALLFG